MTGRSPTRGNAAGMHCVFDAWQSEAYRRENFRFTHTRTESMAADVFAESLRLLRRGLPLGVLYASSPMMDNVLVT